MISRKPSFSSRGEKRDSIAKEENVGGKASEDRGRESERESLS